MTSTKPRELTQEEREHVWQNIGESFFPDQDISILDDYYFVAFDYISDCPGYAGVLIFAVFGMPEYHYVWTLNKDGVMGVVNRSDD